MSQLISNFSEFPQFLSLNQKPGAESHKTGAKWLSSGWKTKPSDSSPEPSCLDPGQSEAQYLAPQKSRTEQSWVRMSRAKWKKMSLVEWCRAKCKILWSQAKPAYVKLDKIWNKFDK